MAARAAIHSIYGAWGSHSWSRGLRKQAPPKIFEINLRVPCITRRWEGRPGGIPRKTYFSAFRHRFVRLLQEGRVGFGSNVRRSLHCDHRFEMGVGAWIKSDEYAAHAGHAGHAGNAFPALCDIRFLAPRVTMLPSTLRDSVCLRFVRFSFPALYEQNSGSACRIYIPPQSLPIIPQHTTASPDYR